MPSWLSRHISTDLDFLKCGCQHGNPQASPQMDRDMIRSPSLCTEEFLVLQFPNVLTEICLSGEGWEGGGSLYNMDLMLGFAHWVFITRPHKKQKSSVEKIKKNFFFFYKDRQVRGSDTFSTLWFLRTKINGGKKEDSIFMLWKSIL